MNNLPIPAIALAFAMLSASSPSSRPVQSKCNLTEATAPSVRGLKLGMTAQQFLVLFPGITKNKEMKDSIEHAKSPTRDEPTVLGVDPAADGNRNLFAGVESVGATFYKSRVIDFTVQYGGATWDNIDQWVSKLSDALKLPPARDWLVSPNETPNKSLSCDGILIEATTEGGSASIRIRSTSHLREMEERQKAAEERKRQQVKP
jgi:hypothetical protein